MAIVASSGGLAMELVIGVAVFLPFPVLAVLCWIFWRAKKRDDAEREGRLTPQG